MSLLDRYIAGQFLMNVLVLTVILCCFVVAVDVSVNLDRFQSTAAKLASSGPDGEAGGVGGVREAVVVVLVIADLWWPRLLQLVNFLIGIIMVGAMGFTCVQLVRNRELIAMVAAGVSLFRVARPIFIVAVGLTVLQGLNQELVIPRIAPLLTRDHGNAGRRTASESPVPLTADRGLVLRAESFDDETDTMTGVFVVDRGGDGRAERVIKADRAVWRDGAWQLENGRAERRAAEVPTEPVSVLETSIDPARIVMDRDRAFEQALSFGQVTRMLSRPELLDEALRERLERIRWGRFGVMACNLLALAIGVRFYISRAPTDIMQRTLWSLPFVGVALIGGVLGASGGVPGLPAALGVFVPALVMAPVAYGALTTVKT